MRKIVYIPLMLLIGLSSTANVWAAESETANADSGDDTASQTSNIQSWQEKERRDDNWTWFGMGYESRRSFSEAKGAPASGAAGGGGKAPGSGGPGGRR
ncbi:MAG: hypothetical protein P8045_10445 [Candidatus Thiodiazotropha sp.]